jgi:general secretion pathway protein C
MLLRLPLARIATVLLFAALCAIVAAWAVRLLAPRSPIAPTGSVASERPATDRGSAVQLFGALVQPGAVSAAPPSNIKVAGVLAAGERGVALLAINGRPAKPFAVGEQLEDGSRVRRITGDSVELERDGRAQQLPAPARPSLDVLTAGPRAAAAGGVGAPPVPLSPVMPASVPRPAPTSAFPPLPQRTVPSPGTAPESPAPQAISNEGGAPASDPPPGSQ